MQLDLGWGTGYADSKMPSTTIDNTAIMIGIHQRTGSFSDKWIEYCTIHKIGFKLVNCYDSDIIYQLKDCAGLMWHWAQYDSKAILFARQLTYSLEHIGKKVFPDSKTCWHFDDKAGQKYLLEAIGSPLVKSYIFYDKEKAIEWANETSFPKVFKLRGGAGSVNVKLVTTSREALHLISKRTTKPSWNLFANKLLMRQS
ncbi:hypothetical protein [Syntrophus gentianae]|nr:hypothetical protein [Syntrophus gentianae]